MKPRGGKFARLALLALLGAAVAWAAVHRPALDAAALAAAIRHAGPWAPPAFIVSFATATVLFLPGALFGLAGGALFGPVWGTVCNLCGAGVGATVAFLVARHLAADWAAARAGGRLRQLVEGVEAEGWRFVAFVRLVPVFPFNLMSYALGLTRIRLAEYVLATVICMAPGTIAYAYLGYAGREAVAGGEGIVKMGLVALALVAMALFLPRLVRRPRSRAFAWIDAAELRARILSGDAPLVVDVRGADEFDGDLGHLESARNIPVAEMAQRMGELARDKARPIVLVCRTQMRSAAAAATLREAGFRNLAVLRGGMTEWRRLGLPVDERALPRETTA